MVSLERRKKVSEKKKELIKKAKVGISNNFVYGDLALNWLYEEDFLEREVLTTYIINGERFTPEEYTSEEILNKLLDTLNENDLEEMISLLNKGILNKEKAKDVIIENFDRYGDGLTIMKFGRCPLCGGLLYDNIWFNYCPNCGQRLKW